MMITPKKSITLSTNENNNQLQEAHNRYSAYHCQQQQHQQHPPVANPLLRHHKKRQQQHDSLSSSTSTCTMKQLRKVILQKLLRLLASTNSSRSVLFITLIAVVTISNRIMTELHDIHDNVHLISEIVTTTTSSQETMSSLPQFATTTTTMIRKKEPNDVKGTGSAGGGGVRVKLSLDSSKISTTTTTTTPDEKEQQQQQATVPSPSSSMSNTKRIKALFANIANLSMMATTRTLRSSSSSSSNTTVDDHQTKKESSSAEATATTTTTTETNHINTPKDPLQELRESILVTIQDSVVSMNDPKTTTSTNTKPNEPASGEDAKQQIFEAIQFNLDNMPRLAGGTNMGKIKHRPSLADISLLNQQIKKQVRFKQNNYNNPKMMMKAASKRNTKDNIPKKQTIVQPKPWRFGKLNKTIVPAKNQVYTIGSLENDFQRNVTRYLAYDTTESIHRFGSSYWENKFCDKFVPDDTFANMPGREKLSFHDSSVYNTVQEYTMVNMTFSCYDVYTKSGYGTGNFILAFGAQRLAATLIGNIDIQLHCTDAVQMQTSLILPWVMGKFPRTKWPSSIQAQQRNRPTTIVDACYNYNSIIHSIPSTVFQLRRMAVALFGVSHFGQQQSQHPIYQWAETNLWSTAAIQDLRNRQLQLPTPTRLSSPLIPSIEFDETIVHFRCGDIINSQDTRFGFMKFTSIAKYIPATTRSIGIVTQPFSSTDGQQRKLDIRNQDTGYRCEIVINEFISYLRTMYPDPNTVRISIRNDPTETIAITFARMIYASVTIVGVSSFGALAGLASFGTSYVLKTPNGMNRWISTLVEYSKSTTTTSSAASEDDELRTIGQTIHLIDEPLLLAITCRDYWPIDNGRTILRWFRNDIVELNNTTVTASVNYETVTG